MELFTFGIGAGGNKAAIKLVESGVVSEGDIKLLNTTTKDIPEKYKTNKDLFVQFASVLGGCGKEPEKGKKAILNAIKNNKINFGEMIKPTTQGVILVTSTEGGTGCGATPLIAKYFIALNIPVHVFALIGFQDEARGVKNTLKFFKELDDNVILHTIKNEEFLDYSNNYSTAEEAANEYFAEQVKILKGTNMIPSVQNIDETDMYKISTTPGYMGIEHIDLTGVKNEDMFNKTIQKTFDNIKCFDYDKSCKRLAVIINASPKTQDAIDSTFEVIKRYVGEPFEVYRHIQYDENEPEYLDIIACGMNLPKNSILELNKKYNTLKEKLNSKSDSFSDIFDDIDLDEDDEFDMDIRRMNNPDEINKLFADMITEKTPLNNVVIKDSKQEEDDSEY